MLIVNDSGQCTGLFLDSPACQRWGLDQDLSGVASIELLSRRGWQLYSFGPATVAKIVEAYTVLTGRTKLPPLWALGHHQCRWSYPDEKTVRNIAHEFRSRKIPSDAIVLDIDYMDGYRVFTCCRERFPDFKSMVADLAQENFQVVTIVDPGVKKDPKYRVFTNGVKEDVFCKTASGKLFLDKVWPGTAAFPDFVREDVRQWWAQEHKFYVDLGVSGIWNDMNEPALFNNQKPLGDDVRELPNEQNQLFMQQAPEGLVGHFEVRNLYGMEMSHATHDGLIELRPNQRPFVLTRSGYAGVQRYAAVWLGDNISWYEHLAKSIPMLINMGLSGVAFCGADIGGFWQDCSAELLLRWYALGIFYPFCRNHCSLYGRPQEPWVWGADIEAKCRKLIETRYRLIPYIQSLFWEHLRTGAPLMRPLSWHYPNDAIATEIEDEFLFGKDILVAPILQRGKTMRSVYFPPGLWHSFEGGGHFQGGATHWVSFPLGHVPAFVRDGAIVPLADVVQNTAELHNSQITFVCYGESAQGVYFEDDGISFNYEQGQYNEWILTMENDKFTASVVHHGYELPSRKCAFLNKGKWCSVSLPDQRT
ncbi:MAG: DUF5110 domain-containing protein [Candidatus Melainabacteria bacterium]|nr:DUF5110 domain-containing protein [Candidatus Melainabacteria bacterium]